MKCGRGKKRLTDSPRNDFCVARIFFFWFLFLWGDEGAIRHATGPYEDLIITAIKRKLRWYGHMTRSTGLAKMTLQDTVQLTTVDST